MCWPLPCPEGTYKADTGDGLELCLPCDPATTAGAASPDRSECLCARPPGGAQDGRNLPDLLFLPSTGGCVPATAEAVATRIGDEALRNSTLTRWRQHPCERGHYCEKGVRYPCPAGRFGSGEREVRPTCSGVCEAGYYCPEASTTSTEYPCGGSDRYCPEGSFEPILVPPGWYTEEERHNATRTFATLCPKGHWCLGGIRYPCPGGVFGKEEGLSSPSCTGRCAPGFYCPSGSWKPDQVKCGNASVYCPPGSDWPSKVVEGFYTTHAEPYEGLVSVLDPSNQTMSAQLVCEPGHWCSRGVKYQCPAGRFGWAYGDASPDCGGVCAAGHRCPSHPGPPSTRSTQLPCAPLDPTIVRTPGKIPDQSDPVSSYYCPAGTGNTPKRVSAGHYSVGGGPGNTTRTNQVKCERGWWCSGGVKQPCPAGTFGRTRGLTSPKCSGFCPAGFACPQASPEPIKCEPGTYSTGVAKACTRCPGAAAAGPPPGAQACVHSRSCCSF